MNIAIDLLRTDGMSGNQVYTMELTRALFRFFPEHCYRVLLYLNKKRQTMETFGNHPNLHYINILPHENLLGHRLKPIISYAVNKATLSVARRSDIYHCTNPNRFPFGIGNGVVTLHDLIALRAEPWASAGSQDFYRRNIGKVLREAMIVFAVSEFTRQDAIRHFPECAGKIIVTPLAAAPLFKKTGNDRNFLSRYGISDTSKPYLLYVGELQQRKNIGALLSAFDALPPRLRSELQVIIVGSAKSRENQDHFSTALQAMKHRDQVFHLKNVHVEDLVRLYNGAHAFVYLSFYEGFGLPVLEAMSCGCPVLTSANTSLKEIAGDAALTVNPADPDEILNKLQRLVDTPSLHKELSERGLLRAGEFSWQQTAEATMGGYHMITKT